MDVLIPAALENQITMDNAPVIKAKVLTEGANGPTTPDAHQHLHERGVFVIPDILANSGGVTTSYFEWVQDRYGYFWELDEVNARLEKKMVEAFDDVLQTSLKYTVDLRRPSWMWFDPTLASVTVGASATFDNLTGQYQVSRLQNGAVVKSDRVTQEADVRAALTAFDRVPLDPRPALQPNADYYLRVRLRTQPRLSFSLWPFGSDDGTGRKDFTFIK